MTNQSENNLENLVERSDIGNKKTLSYNPSHEEKRSLYEKAKNVASDYLVDVSAGWTFFTPIYTAMEHYVAGMDSGEVFDSRSTGLVAHSVAMRPAGLLRNALAKKWNVSKQSPFYKKWAVNACAQTPIQAVMYTGMLAYAGASPQEIAIALPIGLAMAFPLFEPFGRWMDKWRKIWGKKPAIK
ncbi:MAG: L-alanine exporter AlaE [Nanoarchaeota archaeon]